MARLLPSPASAASRAARAASTRGLALAPGGSSGKPERLARVQVALRAQVGQRAHAADVGGALGDADGAAGVEDVEGVGALQAVVVGRQRQPELEEPLALRLVGVEEAEEHLRVGRREASTRSSPPRCGGRPRGT